MQYRILFECAWSQPASNLNLKIKKCLENPVVLAVICFNIQSLVKFQMPTEAPPAEHNLVSEFPEDVLQQRTLLGPVKFCGHNWGQVDDISLTIHHQGGKTEPFVRFYSFHLFEGSHVS